MTFDKSKFIPRFIQEAREYLDVLAREFERRKDNPSSLRITDELVRAAHTIKGSAKILGFKPVSKISQKMEEILRNLQKQQFAMTPDLHSLLSNATGLLEVFINQIERGEEVTTDIDGILENLDLALKGEYQAPASSKEPAPQSVATPTESSSPREVPPETEDSDEEKTVSDSSSTKKAGGFDRSKFVSRFVDEARDHINTLNEGLINLETQPGNLEILDQIFRVSHTLKGSSKILGLKPISLLAHRVEDVLDSLRNNKFSFGKPLCDLLLKSVDLIAEFVEQISQGKALDTDIRPLIETLESAARGEAVTKMKPGELAETVRNAESKEDSGLVKSVGDSPQTIFKTAMSDTVRINTSKLDDTVKLMGEIVSNHIRMKQNVLDIDEVNKLFIKYLDHLGTIPQSAQGPLNGQTAEIIEVARSIHDKLKVVSSQTRDVMSFQSLVTDDLREKVLRMRMLPLSTVLDGFPRLVRDISNACGKQVTLEILGGATELDKKIIERIGDPLLHMVRNSIDHGIELPETRVAHGKAEAGSVSISAAYEGGHVLITISDDGAGIPVDKIREKAVMKKIYDEETAQNLPDSEIINLIFRPGFSTTALVTEISGRGVGMDVVRDNLVKHLKGSLQIETKLNKGTTFFIRLPLTLAVMRVMLVSLGEMQVAIPLNAIREIVRVPANTLIEVVNRYAVSLRDQIIPVTELKTLLESEENNAPEKSTPQGNLVVLIVAMGSEMLGLIVDEIVTEEDMEIKPLPDHMKHNELVSGITLSGKNEIVLVLQITRLFNLARESREEWLPSTEDNHPKKKLHILVVDDSVSTRHVEKNILESRGYRVDLASDGAEGFEKAMETQYDLILTDVEMPRMDGFTLTESLRQESNYRHTPIIILSSRSSEMDKARGMEAGANGYLTKGEFDPQQLTDAIENLVQ